ncbi:MAG: T9SS type A sorting domain-containing protein [Chitinophagales bacterium]|nr:T9SS type A sorting domain-containing protein [Chitinophagales bacterium]
MNFNPLLLFVVLFFSTATLAQTTYTWIGATGASWAVSTNWSPTRTTPAATDIIKFDDGGTYLVTAVPTQTIRQLLISDSTTVTLQSSGTTTLTINGPTLTDNLMIREGSTLDYSATNTLTITMTTTASQRADISGTLNVRTGTFTTTGVGTNLFTVSATGVVNHFSGTITGSAATFAFAAGSNYNYLSTGALTIPTAAWDTTSNVNITGITSAATIGIVNGQSFGHFTYNCTSQGNVVVSLYSTAATPMGFTVKGNLNVQSTGSGTGSLSFKTNTGQVIATVNGVYNQSGGVVNANTAATAGVTLNFLGGYTQTGGTFNLNTAAIACAINVGGNFNQTAGTFTQTSTTVSTLNFTQAGSKTYSALGTVTNTYINYAVVSPCELTLNTNLTTSASRTFTVNSFSALILGSGTLASAATSGGLISNSGTLNCGTNIITGSGGFTNVSTNTATLILGDQLGITTGTTLSGNIQVTGGRTYGVNGNYVYTGTNGQSTGNGLPATLGGYVQVNLQNNTDQITFATTAFSGNLNLRLRSGSLANAITYSGASSTLTYEGVAAQTTTSNEFPAASGPAALVINNANGVTLHAPRSLSWQITLTNGLLNTTTANVLTLLNTSTPAVVGGADTSFVNGPLIRAINSNKTYDFPVGEGAVYAPFDLNTSAVASGVQIRVQYVDAATGGSAGLGLAAINPYYWRVERTAGTTDMPYTVRATKGGLVADSRVGYATSVAGAYANQGGVNISTGVTSVLTNTISTANPNAYYTVGTSAVLSGTVSAINLTTIADLLRTQIVSGNVIFELPTTYSGEPVYPVNFTAFTEDGSGPYFVTIRPTAGSPSLVTAGDPGTTNPLINFNGIDRLTIDGRIGGAGAMAWTFRNTRTATTVGPTFQFINDATSNTLTYLNIEGQNITASSGTIVFSTATGLSLGNSNNTISYCSIHENTATGTTPANGIFSIGTAGINNANNTITNNNIYNNFVAGTTGAGVWIGVNNVEWTISNNHFYQTAPRTGTGAVARYGIYVLNGNALSTNFIISGNYIGGSTTNAGGSAMSIGGNVNHSFVGIHLSTLAAGNNLVEGNVIRNITMAHGTTANTLAFVGIYDLNGNNEIKGNTVGSLTGTSLITINSNLATASATYGIFLTSGIDTISNNTIGGFVLSNATGIVGFTGIHTAVTTGSPTVSIEGNTIAKVNAGYTGTTAGGFVRGIYITGTTTAGPRVISSNTIYDLNSSTGNTGTGALAVTAGIVQLSTTAGHIIENNKVYSLTNAHPTAATNVVGLYYDGATTGTNAVTRNFVHSLSMATSSTTAATTVYGIQINTGVSTIANNMVRLGVDSAGNATTTNHNIRGIDYGSATAGNLFYYNSVYLGGVGVGAGANNTYAFYRSANSTALSLLNNIFINARSNNTGTGRHVALGLSAAHSAANLTSNHNLYHAPGTGGAIGMIATTAYDNIVAWQTAVTPDDNNSISGAAGFIDATGNADIVDLHINPATPTQAESGGVFISGFDNDYDGDIRQGSGGYAGTGTAPDIGADEGEFIATDATPPLITYTLIPTQTSFVAPTLSATITDANAVDVSAGNAPRIYFKRSTDANEFNDNTSSTAGWKFVESTTGSSPFALAPNYSLLFGGTGVSAGNTIQYFVVAQDASSNVAINSGTFAAAPSNIQLTAAAFPIGGTINNYYINVLSGTYTVGTGGDFTSLTNAGGLFQTINSGALSGNVIAEITTDLTVESGLHPLNQWTEIAGSGYTLTIRPSAATTRTISGTFNGELYRMDGADRVTIDGRSGGSGQYLVFANTSATTAAATFSFLNEATNNTIRYCYLRGSSTATAKGVVLFGTSTATGSLGNSSNIIEYCDIHQNAAALPTNGIYSAGTAAKLNINNTIRNNNIYNFFNAAGGSNGIALAANTSAWTIENNRFYQEATRTTTSASTFHYVIFVNNTANANTVIRGNYIGGSAADGSGVMTYTAAVGNQFAPIYLNTSAVTATPTIVENNTITNLAFTTVSAATSGIGPFTAIYQLAGASYIAGNTIGAATGTGAITVTVNTNALGVTNAIRYEGTATVKIVSNTIGAMTVTGTGTNNGQTFYAVNVTTGNVAIKNNNIGSATTANSLQITGTSTGNASVLGGINIVGAAGYVDSICFNNLHNLTNFNAGAATRVLGISATSGSQFYIEDNTIRNLSLTASTNVGTTSTPAVLGIALVTANTGVLTLSRNKVYALSNAGSGLSAWTTGIHYSGGTNAANTVEDNFVHSLSPSSGATASVVGIQLAGGTTTNVRNNMIRLGIDASGASIAQTHNLYGIQQTANNIHNIYHNSVYVGGTGVGGALPTFAYQRNNATVTTATDLRNNIFINNRSNGAGTGVHYAVGFTAAMTTTLTSDFNVYHTTGTGGSLGLMGATPYTTLTAWKTGTSKDAASLYGNPEFVNATGNTSVIDLHINPLAATPVEANGTNVGVVSDYDGDVRSGLTPTDIGADAGNFLPIDIVAPIITYTNLSGVCNTASSHTLTGVTITDALSNVNITTGTKPRVYFKKSTAANDLSGWQYAEANGTTSPFDFTIDFTALGGVSAGELIQYFIVAQDQGALVYTPNVAINSGSFAATPVSVALTSAAFPIGGTINSFAVLPCAGTVTVGTGGAYPSLTNDGGLFQALNAATLSSSVTATVISDLTVESGTHALNQWNESGAGGYQVTLTPDAGTLRTISGTYAGANAATAGLFRINGADRFVVDGRNPADLAAGGRHLLFRNSSATAVAFNSTFNFLNDATNNTIRYAIIEGATLGSTNGVIRFSDGITTGNDNIIIDRCQIRDRSDAAGLPLNGIYATSIAGAITNNVSITNNEIFNFWGAAAVSSNGISITSGNADWTIAGNSLYQTGTRAGGGTVIHYGIQIDNSTNGNNFIVENNYIGGTATNAGGTAWTITGTNQVGFIGIFVNAQTSGSSTIQNNTVANFNISTSRTSAFPTNTFIGIISASNGSATIEGNTVGNGTGTGSIIITNTTSTGAVVVGIGHQTSSGTANINNNTVGSFTITSTGSFSVSFNGIRYGQGGSASTRTISNNLIGSLTTANSININTGSNSATAQDVIGINMTTGANPVTISGNTIANMNNNRPVTGASQVVGIHSSFAANTITGNTIRNLTSNANNELTGASAGMVGILVNASLANGHTISNNIIHSLVNTSSSNAAIVTGIYYNPAAGGTNVIDGNFIHSIYTNSGSATAQVSGIYINAGSARVSNNMIRLGHTTTGTSIATPNIHYGIYDNAGTNNYYHNSVYVGGSSVTGATNTYAFYSAVSSGTRAIQNNIFWNARSNGSGSGKHYAIRIGATTGLTCNYNDLLANGTGAVLGANNTTDYASFNAWKTGTTLDANSINGAPGFVNATGGTAAVDLHIDVLNPTLIESAGTPIGSVAFDFDGDDRSANTPTDIGADAGLFIGLDATPPNIAYTTISNVCNTATSVSLSATITDNSSVNVTAGTKPRLYFKKSTTANTLAGWQYVEASNAASPFNFSFNFTVLGGVNAGDVVQYFVVAQDEGALVITPNVTINSGTFAATPAGVDLTSAAFPIGGTINQFEMLPCEGTITVGTGGNYPAFTTATGFFRAVNLATVTGNLTINVVSDISIEDGTHALNAFAAPYMLTIQPDGSTLRNVYGTYNGASAAVGGLFRFNGADRVIIDGRDPNNLAGNGRFLLFRNSDATASSNFNSTYTLINDAQNNTFRYTIFEGATVGNSNGVVLFSTGTTSGNSNNTIDNCFVKNAGATASLLNPSVGIYSGGTNTAGIENSNVTISNNSIYDFFSAAPTVASSAVRLGGSTLGADSWTITGNSIYQTASRNFTSGGYYGISVEHTGNKNFVITGNYIGGSAPLCAGTAWTQTGSGYFVGIRLSVSTNSPVSSVQGNTIQNINITTATTSTASAGIGIPSGSANVGTVTANIIGDAAASVGSPSIVFNGSGVGSQFAGINAGLGTAGALNIQNNIIAGISITGSTGIPFRGMAFTNSAPTALTVSNNTIGSTTVANSISNNTNGSMIGIQSTLGSTTYTLSGNTIANISAANTGTNASIVGIQAGNGAANGSYNIQNNTIRNLSTDALITSTGASAAAIGILLNSTSVGHTISGNTIHSISSSAPTQAVQVIGLHYAGSTTGTNTINANQIHSLSLVSTATTAQMQGINIASGTGTFSNNMVRLGINAAGTALTNTPVIAGIDKSTSSNANVYFNTVYIGGSGVGTGTVNTFAFRKTTSSTDNVRNNIFVNARSNSTTGGKHYAAWLNNASGLTNNYNIYNYSGTGGTFVNFNGTDLTTMQALRFNTGGDLNSGIGSLSQINFVNATGDAANVNLRLNNANCAAGAGQTISGITSDFDGTVTRATPPAIGAHESASFNAIATGYDIYTPVITVSSVPALTAACGSSQTVSITATINDVGLGVATGGNQPMLWWRLSSGTYASLAPSSQVGNTYTYQLNLTGITAGQTYHYYVVAQDNESPTNVFYSNFNATTPIHSSTMATPSPTNGNPATFTVSAVTPLSGTVTVGTGGNYTSLTQFSGLFLDIFNRGLSGDLRVEIISNTTEDGNQSLNNWTEYCGSGYRVTIVPSSASVKTLSGSLLGMGLFGIYASRVTIDGSFNGSGRYLKFENTYASSGGSENSVFRFGSGSPTITTTDTLRNCDVVGNTTKTAGGVVHMHNINGLVIENNLLHGGSPDWAMNIIRSDGGSDITIRNNEIYNFLGSNGGTATRSYGILVPSGAGSNWTITGNSIYNTGINGQNVQTALAFLPGSSSTNNIISNNWIGGSSAQCGTGGAVTYWGNSYTTTSCTEVTIKGINVNAGSVTIDNNNISNIYLLGCDYVGFVGIHIQGATIASMSYNVLGTGSNGVPDNSKIIRVAGGGCSTCPAPGYIYGIWNQSTSTTTSLYDHNDFYYMWQSGAYWGGSVQCIVHQAASPVTITANRINGPQATGLGLANSFGIRIEPTANTSGNLIQRNSIAGPYINGGVALGNDPSAYSANHGIYVRSLSSRIVSGTIDRNVVWDLRNGEVGGYGSTGGITLNGNGGGNGAWDIINNQVTLKNNGSTANSVGLYGIDVMMNATSTTNVLYNSVYISGDNGTTVAYAGADFTSAAFFRMPNGTGNVAGDNITLKNNIFINYRLFSTASVTGHFAIANYGSSNFATNWTASDNNFLAVNNGSKSYLGIWGTTLRSTLAQWQASSTKDLTSYTSTPTTGASNFSSGLLNADNLFLNPLSDLHISNADGESYKFIQSRAAPITITTDFDGDTRNATTPDIGADEIFTCLAPSVSTHPSNQSVCVAASATFSIVANGTTPTYQWQEYNGSTWSDITNGGIYSGATTNTLDLTGVTAGMNNYQYRAVVTACSQSVNSNAATLTVYPAIADNTVTSDQTICTNTIPATLTGSAPTGGSGSYTYQWQISTTSAVTGFTNIGSATAQDYSPGSAITQNTWYRRTVNSATCSNTSDAVQVTVEQPATITSSSADMCQGSTRTLVASAGGGVWSAACGPCVSGNVFTAPQPGGSSANIQITYTLNSCPDPTQQITVYRSPYVVDAGTDMNVCGSTTQLSATALTVGSGAWTVAGGSGTFTPNNLSLTPTVSGISNGANVYRWTATNGACTAFDEVTVLGNVVGANVSNAVGTFNATRECLDIATGWTHYFDNGADAVANTGDDRILLSIKKNGNNIGTIGIGGFDVKVAVEGTSNSYGAGYGNGGYVITSTNAPYVQNNINAWAVMARYWDVTPTAQPNTDVDVRFYFSETDYQDLLTTASDKGWQPIQNPYEDLQFYKVLGAADPNPATGHDGLTTSDVLIYDKTTAYPGGHLWNYAQFGSNHQAEFKVSSFSGGGGGFGGGGQGALPVTLLYLTATPVSNTYIRLDWATALEINNYGFEIQRSTDAQNWSNIGWADGYNNSTVTHTYLFNDYNVQKGIVYYYRLKQIDNDGHYTYTYIVSATLSNSGGLTVINFVPNPTISQTNLLITTSNATEISVEFYNGIGQKVSSGKHDLQIGANSIAFDVENLAAGTYNAIVINGDERISRKLIVVR